MSHAPMWPQYVERSTPLRTLAYESHGKVTTEHGDSWEWETWEDMEQLLEEHNLLVLAEGIESVVTPAIEQPNVKIRCSKDGTKINSISTRIGRKIRHVVPASSWQVYRVEDLQKVRRFLRHMKVGDRITPSGVGAALSREVWRQRGYPRHTVPPKRLQERIQTHKQPARSQWFYESIEREAMYEYDLSNAYAQHFQWHPTGSAERLMGVGHDARFCTWFQRCVIRINAPVKLAPFGIQKRGRGWGYPTAPGIYGLELKEQVWLWKEQADECAKLGIDVQPIEGYGWTQMTGNNAGWVKRITKLRDTAPDEIRGLVKQAIVGTIGRQDIAGPNYELIHGDIIPEPGDRPVLRIVDGSKECPLTDLYTRESGYSHGGMCHWAIYTVMKCNLTVFRAALSRADDLVQINFDGIVLSERVRYRMNQKWKETRLNNVRVVNRRLYSDEVTRTPGIKKGA